MEKFARKCDISGKGMNEGYCFNDGEFYCATEVEAKQHVESLGYNWEEELKTINTKDEWFYWTEWDSEETEEEWYNSEGNLYQKEEVLELIYTIHAGIPDEYITTRNKLTARKIYIDKAKELGVKFPEETSNLGIDELHSIVREQLEWTEKEIRWESANLI